MSDAAQAQAKAADQEGGNSATDAATALAKMMKMLERIDERVTEIESRSVIGSALSSAPLSPALMPQTPMPQTPTPQTPTPQTPMVQAEGAIGQTPMEFGAGLTLNELGASGFGARSVFKQRAEHAHAGRDSIYKTPGQVPPGVIKIPKLMIDKFSGEELYVGLGPAFKTWAFSFLEAIEMAELQCQFAWGERLKVNKLGEHMEPNSIAAAFFKVNVWTWWAANPSLYYALDQMYLAFKVTITHQQAAMLFASKKDPARSWNQHLLYLTTLCHESGSKEELIVENIVKFAAPHMSIAIMIRYNSARTDYLTHAQELVAWAQEIDDGSKTAKLMGKDTVNAVVSSDGSDPRKCYNCGNRGHISRNCPYPQKEKGRVRGRGRGRANFVLAVAEPVDTDMALAASIDDETVWVVNSGASRHLIQDPLLLQDATDCNDEQALLLPDGGQLEVTKRGSVTLYGYACGRRTRFVLTDVYYAPKLARNLISMGRLFERGCSLRCEGDAMVILKEGQPVFDVRIESGVFLADLTPEVRAMTDIRFQRIVMSAVTDSASTKEAQKGSLYHYHVRFGHLAYDTIERMAKDPDYGIELTDHVRANCLTCAEGKGTRTPQPQQDSGTNAPTDRVGGVICSDLKGPITPTDRRGNRYLVVFIDYKSNYVRVFAARKKDAAAKMFEHFLAWFERQFNCRIHVLRTDGGGEYAVVDLFCKETGVRRQVTEPNTPQSNGKAERMNRTIFNMVRCMIFGSGLALVYWSEAAEYAAYILNRSPTRANPKRMSPIEMLTGHAQNLQGIVVFGSPCMVWRDPKKKALKQHAERALIIGKNEETKGYKVVLLKDKVVTTTRHVFNIETLDATANQQILRALEEDEEAELERIADERARAADETRKATEARKAKESDAQRKKDTVAADTSGPKEPEPTGPRRSKRDRKQSKKKAAADAQALEVDVATPSRAEASAVTTKQGRTDGHCPQEGAGGAPVLMAFAVLPATKAARDKSTVPDPANYRAARRGPDSAKWAVAEQEELKSLEANATWTIVKRPPGVRPLPTKWVYKTKLKADGTVERYKARLVARGDKQVYGENYFLTFSTVIPIGNAFVILTFSRIWGVPARHGDVPSAYPKAFTESEYKIYLLVPDGMMIPQHVLHEHGVSDPRELVLLLGRSLYGLKQAGRLWHELLRETVIRLGFVQCVSDPCIFYKLDGDGMTLIGTYVDDLLVTGTSTARVDQFFADMAVLELKDLGVVEKFLGMRVSWSKEGGYLIDQEQTIDELLERHGLQDANPVRVPVTDDEGDGDTKLLPIKSTTTPRLPTVKDFQSLVGSLLWVSRCTRPDIAFAVHKATRRSHAPTMQDYKLAKKIARYLKGTKTLKLRLQDDHEPASPVRIISYSDADFAADKTDRKSISAGVQTVNGMTVGWHCRKQSAVAQSTAEAELVAAAVGGREALGLKELYEELGQRVKTPVVLKIDNQAAVKQIDNEASSASIKHVDVKLKFLRDYARKKVIKPVYEATKTMVADLLTKVLPAPRIQELCTLIGLE